MTKNKNEKKSQKPKKVREKKARTTSSDSVGVTGGDLEGNTNQQVAASKSRGNQVKHWFFTWNNHTESDIQLLLECFKHKCYRWRFEEEIGGLNNTPHLQGVCSVKAEKGIRFQQFGLPSQIHWEKTKDLAAAAKYCEKDYVSNGARMWEAGFPARLKLITELRPFQSQLKQMLDAEPDDRSVVVIYDPKGDMGKTQFIKYYLSKNPGCFTTGGDYKDIACTINLYFQNGTNDINNKWVFFMALSRDQNMQHVSYRVLEGVKDGLLSSNKYESNGLIFNSPHVIMLTNNLPIQTRPDGSSTMSADRWRVYTINDDMELEIYEPWYSPEFKHNFKAINNSGFV